MNRILIAICTLTFANASALAQQGQCLPEASDRPTVALVLGGGGARGAAHIGVIRALEEMRVPVDLIVGTSMGSLVGGLHSAGMSSQDLENLIADIDWSDVFSDQSRRQDRHNRRKRDDALGLYGAKIGLSKDGSRLPSGAVAGQKVLSLLETLVAQRDRSDDFDELPIPFRAVAVDILSAETVVIDSGRLSRAMRASMAIPAVFDPVSDGDRLLVDGGVLMNLPVSVAKDVGVDVVIAVDVGSPLADKDKVKNILQILYQLTGVVTVVNTRQQKALLTGDDIFLQPEIDEEISTGSFAEAIGAVPAGYEAAMVYREQLSGLSVDAATWDRRAQRLAYCLDGPPEVQFVELNNQSRFDDSVIRYRLDIPIGEPLDFAELDAQVQDIYSLGFLQQVTYEIIETEQGTGVRVDVLPDNRGTSFLEYGVGVNSTNLTSSFNLRLGYLKTDVGRHGGEFRVLGQIGQDLGGVLELYLPLGPSRTWFVQPRLAAEHSDLTVFDDDGNRIYQLGVNERIAEMAFGREIGVRAAIFAGLRTGEGDVGIHIGDPLFPAFDFERGEYFARLEYDTVDSIFFPGDGGFGSIEYLVSTESLGALQEFEQLESLFVKAWTVGRHSFVASATVEVSSDDAIPVQNLYRSGGFPRMSGFEYNELIGENFGMVMGGYRYKLLEGGLLPGYLGGTVEYGNVARERSDLFSNGILNGSVYFGIDSFIGPVYFGVGWAEGRNLLPFLSIGSIFTRSSLVR